MNLEKLQSFLAQDPENLTLLSDAATAAYEAGALENCDEYLSRYERLSALPAHLTYLKGIAALERNDFIVAMPYLEKALVTNNDPAGRFALAWAKALAGDFTRANALLDEAAIATSPRGPGLKVNAMHHLGLLEEALEAGEKLFSQHSGDESLAAVLATVALDADQPELAARYARAGGEEAAAITARATLALNAGDRAGSTALWDKALEKRPNDGRALIGKGLSLMLDNQPSSAADFLDRGAERFKTHIGSWIAAGWAYFAQSDYAKARARFETALSIDDRFADSHGSLAVLDLLDGDIESAKMRMETARRLDGASASAAFAASIFANKSGNAQTASAILEKALQAPIDESGRTLGEAIAKLGVQMGR